MPQKRKQIAGYMLIAVFAFYYADICFFYHSHTINGVTIVHSHFHTGAHEQTGTHNNSELTLISMLSVFHSLQASLCFTGGGILLLLQEIIRFFSGKKIVRHTAACISLRAPPCPSRFDKPC
jgi:hypothetical protein